MASLSVVEVFDGVLDKIAREKKIKRSNLEIRWGCGKTAEVWECGSCCENDSRVCDIDVDCLLVAVSVVQKVEGR